jgi:hypothetical protein
MLSCLAILLRKQPPPQRTEAKYQNAVSIVDRILAVDRLIPSYGNVISVAGLQVCRGSQNAIGRPAKHIV